MVACESDSIAANVAAHHPRLGPQRANSPWPVPHRRVLSRPPSGHLGDLFKHFIKSRPPPPEGARARRRMRAASAGDRRDGTG